MLLRALLQFWQKQKWPLTFLGSMVIVYLIIPVPKFNDPTSTIVYAEDNQLLGAKIAADEQWRFPMVDSVPSKIAASITVFEDKYFRYHPGFNPVSIVRALVTNIKAGEARIGGSTITMQVVRLARKGQARTIKEKLIELFFATKLEIIYSKDEILALYLSHAPFGGNVVGIEAASWRYYGRSPWNLSWAEAATLAVLPNAPSLIFPGKNQKILEQKRNRLLKSLLDEASIDSITYQLSLQERLPGKPKNLPSFTPHVTDHCHRSKEGQRVYTTIDAHLQYWLYNLVSQHVKRLANNEIHNIAVVIADVNTANILAYIGNSSNSKSHGNDVDVVQAPRSTGSILKPLLYASMLNDGAILPTQLIPDIPLYMDGFAPKNYHLTYDGAVPAEMALSRSLNVPAVHLLKNYGVAAFHNQLKMFGLSTINQAPDHYGLSLILGGAEATLWDLCKVYTNLARTLVNTVDRNYQYSNEDFTNLTFYKQQKNLTTKASRSNEPLQVNSASIWFMLEAMLEVNRPENESGWENFSTSQKIAWKTGTSFGFRDAWAIGITPKYVVGVWVGNADGEGRPGLVGTLAAAPVMFDVFDHLPSTNWFLEPYQEIKEVPLCRQSGHLPSVNCIEKDTVKIPENGLRSLPCPFHKVVTLTKNEKYRVSMECVSEDTKTKSWFVLPPAMEYFYKQKHPFYLPLPPYKKDCANYSDQSMAFIYPNENTKVYIPIDMSGRRGETILEVAHRNKNSLLYWHLNDTYLGSTETIHQMAISPIQGVYNIIVVDNDGNSISRTIEVVDR